VRDCTSGFRAIRTELLAKINLDRLYATGYSFQISLLHNAIRKGARTKEIPIIFSDRKVGNSKLGKYDIIEFFINSFRLRFQK